MSTFHPLIAQCDLHDGLRRVYSLAGITLLLVQEAGQVYLLENKCGHFGVPLDKGHIEGCTIRCPSHGIVFDMNDGRIVKSRHDQCDPVRVFSIARQGDWLGVVR